MGAIMKINQRFKTREDLDSHFAYFELECPLEMSEVAVFITNLLQNHQTRKNLVSIVQEKFPQTNATSEVDEVINTYTELEILEH